MTIRINNILLFYSEYGLRSENGFGDKKNDHDRYVKNILCILYFFAKYSYKN